MGGQQQAFKLDMTYYFVVSQSNLLPLVDCVVSGRDISFTLPRQATNVANCLIVDDECFVYRVLISNSFTQDGEMRLSGVITTSELHPEKAKVSALIKALKG